MGGLFCNPAGHTTLAKGKGGAGADGMQGGSGGGGRTEQAYTTTYQPIPLLHPSVCELMVSPFFPTDNRRSRLATSSNCVEVLGASREGEEGRKQGRKCGNERWMREERGGMRMKGKMNRGWVWGGGMPRRVVD